MQVSNEGRSLEVALDGCTEESNLSGAFVIVRTNFDHTRYPDSSCLTPFGLFDERAKRTCKFQMKLEVAPSSAHCSDQYFDRGSPRGNVVFVSASAPSGVCYSRLVGQYRLQKKPGLVFSVFPLSFDVVGSRGAQITA